MLVVKYHESNCNDKNILVAIDKAINYSIQLRSKKELIEDFIESVNISTKVDEDWRKFVHEQKEKDLAEIIDEERLIKLCRQYRALVVVEQKRKKALSKS